jgi:4-hydroxymandelate oxidase
MNRELDSFLGFFDQVDIDWVLAVGARQQGQTGEALITQGGKPSAIYVLLEGELIVEVKGLSAPINKINPGSLVGEIAFLDSRPATATVKYGSDSVVLCIGKADLRERFEKRPQFEARFYQALGMLLAQRYRSVLRGANADDGDETVATGAETASSMFLHACDMFADREAYDLDGQWITYAQVRERVQKLASALTDLHAGSKSWPIIASVLPNCYQLMETFYAAGVSGSIVFPANHRLAAPELQNVIRTSGASILITSKAFAPTLSQLDWGKLPIQAIVWIDELGEHPTSVKHVSWSALLSTHLLSRDLSSPDPEAYLQCFGTSGTTGAPKVILHSHRSVAIHTKATLAALDLHHEDRHCWGHFGPMFHVGDAAFVWIATALGARHVFNANPLNFKGVAQLMASNGVTICKISPSMLKLMALSGVVESLEFPELRWILTGGAAPDPTLLRQTTEMFGCDFIQGYGMTEATCHVSFKNETQAPLRDGMNILPGLELKILDDERAETPAGQLGEVAIRGVTVFHAQIADGEVIPAAAQNFTADGFYLSGDLGHLDADGKLHVSGRSKDMINVGGENVFAAEVEQIVSRMQGVKQCAAFSMPHADLGEVVEIAIVRSEAGLNPQRVQAWCKQLLASYKVPRQVYFLDELPLTPTGKVRKAALREEILKVREQAESEKPPEAYSGSQEEIETVIAESLEAVGVNHVTVSQSLFEAGLDSLGALDLIERLQGRFGIELPPSLLYEHPTVEALTAYCRQSVTSQSGTSFSGGQRSGETDEPLEETLSGRPLPAALAIIIQALSLLLRPALIAASLIPTVLLAEFVSAFVSPFELFLLGPFFLAVMLACTMVCAWFFKWLISGRMRPGRFALGSLAYHRWLAVNNLFRSLEGALGVLRGSAVLSRFYQLCGARIGKDVRIESVDLQDLDLIDIGSGSYIGRDANLQPGVLKDGALILQRIEIGERSIIGPQASVFGPATLPAESCVLPLDAAPRANCPGSPAPRPTLAIRLAGYLVTAYAATAAIAAGVFLLTATSRIPILWPLLSGAPSAPLDLRFFLLLAITLQLIIPVAYFSIVVVLKRTVLRPMTPGARTSASHWIYARLIDVPFFMTFLRLMVMSHPMKWAYQLLGARVGARPFMAAPYTAEPELLEIGDGAMLAGNVSIFSHDPMSGTTANVVLGKNTIVANSCILTAGSALGDSSLLGDLSRHGGGDVSTPGVIAVGRPPRVVGETKLVVDERSTFSYAWLQITLVVLQLALVAGTQIPGFVALGFAAGWLPSLPHWMAPILIPILFVLPRGVKILLLPAAKWALLGRVREGEYPAYGGMWVRWIAMEALVMDLERTLIALRGTRFLPLVYRAMGCKAASDAWILASALGSEYDLKTIGSGAMLNHRSLVFGHSIERHTLIFKSTEVGSNAALGAFSIAEAGAQVEDGLSVIPHKAVHARRRTEIASDILVNLNDFEEAARQKLQAPVFGYFSGGAGDELALRRNAAAFDKMLYVPRVLVDVRRVSTQKELLGHKLSSPLLVAPVAMNRLAHPDGELAVARAVRRLGLGMILSTLSSTPVENVMLELGEDALGLQQLYVLKNRDVTEALVRRAYEAGCRALVLTVDAPVSGRRESDIRNGFSVASGVELPHLDGIGTDTNSRLLAFERAKDPGLTWEHIKWLVDLSPLPVWLKGIMRPVDALRAMDHGVSGIVLSNHGGRQFDSAPSAFEALPLVRVALDGAGHHVPLLIDGGVRRGEHILKALALGADAVLIGRPALWGLATSGEAGVSRVLGILNEELITAMRLTGCQKLSDIDRL